MVAEVLELITEIRGKEWDGEIGKRCHWGYLMGRSQLVVGDNWGMRDH